MLTLKLKFLKALYNFYDEYAKKFPSVCVPGCATCCTHNVLITTLESVHIISYLQTIKQLELLQKFSSDPPAIALAQARRADYLRPTLTINQLAHCCIHKIEPLEDGPFTIAPCPFLTDGRCPIYEVRPFNCRSLFSEKRCDLSGEAFIHPLLLTVNILFTQLLEHLDTPGFYGNMLDVLSLLAQENNLAAYMKGKTLDKTEGLLPNRRLPGLLCPPEHQSEVKRVLENLYQIKIEGKNFKQYFQLKE